MNTPATALDRASLAEFRAIHGHAPKGVADWSFGLCRQGAWTTFFYSGDFETARHQAIRQARELGCDSITVEA